MSDFRQKLADLKNVIIDVKVNETKVSGEPTFIGQVNMNQYNPEVFIPNGGPVTLKGVSTSALGKSYEEAYDNALAKAVELMGL